MIDLAYPSKNETLRLLGIVRPEKRSETPASEIALSSSIQVYSGTALQDVVIGAGASDDKLDWLAAFAPNLPEQLIGLSFTSPIDERQKRLDAIRRDERAGWVDGEKEFVAKMSKTRQRVWRWLMGFYVSTSAPTSYDVEYDTGISHETGNKVLKAYRAFHGIGG